MIPLVTLTSSTTSQSLDTVLRTALSTGSLEIHGVPTGVNSVSSELLEEPTTLPSSLTAHGPLPLIPGPTHGSITLLMRRRTTQRTTSPTAAKRTPPAVTPSWRLSTVAVLESQRSLLKVARLRMYPTHGRLLPHQIYQRIWTGETLTEPTLSAGPRINTSHNIVDHVGLRDLPPL